VEIAYYESARANALVTFQGGYFAIRGCGLQIIRGKRHLGRRGKLNGQRQVHARVAV